MAHSVSFSGKDDYLNFFDNMCHRDRPLIWVATISNDGRPHLVPTCFVKPLDNNRIAIGCVFVKQTLQNVKRNRFVTLAAVRFSEGYDGYMIKGTGELVDAGDIFEQLKKTVLESSKGKRTIYSTLIVTIEEVYSLRPTSGGKRIR
jgi:predicted pyridoxine 5'-phosphate oxidase superfamily flavin-nucleotide-binding protein